MQSRPMDLHTTYDPEADAVSIRLSDERPYEGAEVEPGVIVHFAKDGRVVGLEFLPASKVLSPGAWSKAPLPGTNIAVPQAAE